MCAVGLNTEDERFPIIFSGCCQNLVNTPYQPSKQPTFNRHDLDIHRRQQSSAKNMEDKIATGMTN